MGGHFPEDHPSRPFSPESIGVNPLTGNYYVGVDDGGTGTPHVFIYSGSSNKLLSDLSRDVYPQITDAVDIKTNPLTNQVYVGSDRGNTNSIVAIIDGSTNAVSALADDGLESAAHALAVDLGTGLLAGAGADYTTLWFPTSDVHGTSGVPISVAIQGVSDSLTIATVPIFRTHNTKPKFTVSATSSLAQNAANMVPQHAFYQVDGWRGTWKAIKLAAKNGSLTATGKVTLPALATGRHILYVYASDGDIATEQSNATGVNSPAISPIASAVFTVEK